MKFYKSFGLLAACAGMLLTGCGNGVSSDSEIVKAAASSNALIVSSSQSYSSQRTNELAYGKALYLANSMSADARIKDESGNVVASYVVTKVTWTVTGDGASLWKHNTTFDDKDNDYQYWKATYPESGDKVSVAFVATVSYGKASKTVTYNFLMDPKA